jgi:hypothetical protein
MPSTSYVPTLLRTSSPTNGGPLAPKRLCLLITHTSKYGHAIRAHMHATISIQLVFIPPSRRSSAVPYPGRQFPINLVSISLTSHSD